MDTATMLKISSLARQYETMGIAHDQAIAMATLAMATASAPGAKIVKTAEERKAEREARAERRVAVPTALAVLIKEDAESAPMVEYGHGKRGPTYKAMKGAFIAMKIYNAAKGDVDAMRASPETISSLEKLYNK